MGRQHMKFVVCPSITLDLTAGPGRPQLPILSLSQSTVAAKFITRIKSHLPLLVKINKVWLSISKFEISSGFHRSITYHHEHLGSIISRL